MRCLSIVLSNLSMVINAEEHTRQIFLMPLTSGGGGSGGCVSRLGNSNKELGEVPNECIQREGSNDDVARYTCSRPPTILANKSWRNKLDVTKLTVNCSGKA